jgi:hypothetical protein
MITLKSDWLKNNPDCKQPEVCSKHTCSCLSLKELVSMDFSKSMIENKTPYAVNKNIASLKPISNWRFQTQEEANLAAALWLTIPIKKRNINEFRYQFRHTLLILGVIESAWLT